MSNAELLVGLLGGGGLVTVLGTLATGIFKWLSGASARERERNTGLNKQRTDAILERDAANKAKDEMAAEKMHAEEYSSMLRRQLLENGITPIDKPEKKE